MSKFVKVEIISYGDYGNGKTERFNEDVWINLDHVVEYFVNSNRINLINGSYYSPTDRGYKNFMKAIESDSSPLIVSIAKDKIEAI